jgi:hypothetical protein
MMVDGLRNGQENPSPSFSRRASGVSVGFCHVAVVRRSCWEMTGQADERRLTALAFGEVHFPNLISRADSGTTPPLGLTLYLGGQMAA